MAGLGKKRSVLASTELAGAMEKLSKAALIDLCITLVRLVDGCETTETEFVKLLDEKYLPPLCRQRGDKLPDLAKSYALYRRVVEQNEVLRNEGR